MIRAHEATEAMRLARERLDQERQERLHDIEKSILESACNNKDFVIIYGLMDSVIKSTLEKADFVVQKESSGDGYKLEDSWRISWPKPNWG